jgi:hypothetical protein
MLPDERVLGGRLEAPSRSSSAVRRAWDPATALVLALVAAVRRVVEADEDQVALRRALPQLAISAVPCA